MQPEQLGDSAIAGFPQRSFNGKALAFSKPVSLPKTGKD